MKIKLLALVLGLQCAWILGTAFTQEQARRAGRIILLETRPVDPRDMLRGDYVTLRYEISDVPLNLFTPPFTNALPAGVNVFVALAPGTNGYYELVGASPQTLAPEAGQVVLRARTRQWWNGGSQGSVRVDYGLERFYVKEGTGNPRGKLTVQAAVPPNGHAVIKQVFVDGVPYAEAMKK